MKISFVYPRFEKFLSNNPDLDKSQIDYFLGDFTTPPSLGIPILAALTPPEFEVELLDDNSGDAINYDAPTDLVAINCFTPQATRAFAIADEFRRAGKKVVMGGFFPSFMVEECLKHADSVGTGEGEITWPQILADLKTGQLKRVYKGGYNLDMAKFTVPKRDIFYHKKSYDWDEDLIQITRGCSYTCGMCAIPSHMGPRIRLRPIEHVVAEIKQLKYENVYLADDTLFFQQRKLIEYSRELLQALIGLGKKYFVSSTMALNTDDKFLDLLAAAGVSNFYCTMNVDPVSIKALQGGEAEQRQLCDLVARLEGRGIRFFGSCAIGRDWDDESIGDRVLNLFDKAGIRTSEFFLFTPYPGSVHWDRLKSQKRIIDETWSHYNGAHVVTRPLNMSPEKLNDVFINIWKEFFKRQKSQHSTYLEPLTFEQGIAVVGKPMQRAGVRGQAVISGIGVLSPIGNTTDSITQSLSNGTTGIRPIPYFDTSHFRTSIGGVIEGFDPHDHLSKEEIALYDDRYLLYAIAAARRAVADARLTITPGDRSIAIVLGTCNGGLLSAEEEYKWLLGKSKIPFTEISNIRSQLYGFGKAITHALKLGGEVWLVNTACSSTTGAIGLAQSLISQGLATTVLVGGSDAMAMANMAGFDGLKATSTTATAPFSLPVGLNVGEAACFWVMEEMEQALLRKARLYGKICGHATTCDAYHPTAPDPRGDGAFRTLRNSALDAGISLDEIGCINAHGTGTDANDRSESKGIARLIETRPVPVTSSKSFFGHCMGTTGILEATCNLLAMNAGFIPPTINFTQPRPGCTLDYVQNTPRTSNYKVFLSANYAFGGNNAAVAISRWDYPNLRPKNPEHRVVITGVGAVTPLGLDVSATLKALRSGKRGIGDITRFSVAQTRSKLAGMVPAFKASDVDRRFDFSGFSDMARFSTAAVINALDNSRLRVSPKNAESVGIAMGVCNASSEEGHMLSVFGTENHTADISTFTNVVANSTAGWTAGALCLKGVNTTLGNGPHSGLQSTAYAYLALREGRAETMMAAAADEVYGRTFYNYDMMDLLFFGDAERNFKFVPDDPKRRVLGEGAAALTLETDASAQARSAPVMAEVLGFGNSMDTTSFDLVNQTQESLVHAITLAIQRAGICADSIDLVVYSPRSGLVLKALNQVLGNDKASTIPLVTSVYHTGEIESASILVDTALALHALESGTELWPQITGDPSIDSRRLESPPRYTLVVATSDLGYHYALVLANGAIR